MRARRIGIFLLFICLVVGTYFIFTKVNLNASYRIGQPLDSLNGVVVFYNGAVNHTGERNLTSDGYNLGIKYQCVEFVKRYYYQHLNHKMPDSYGNAKDFYDLKIQDGELNSQRNLLQFTNPSSLKPEINDLIVFDKTITNPYGHVAIISAVEANTIEIIQQNPGPFGKSRERFKLIYETNKWKVDHKNTLGWLRKPFQTTSRKINATSIVKIFRRILPGKTLLNIFLKSFINRLDNYNF